jgi:hypothetical protein
MPAGVKINTTTLNVSIQNQAMDDYLYIPVAGTAEWRYGHWDNPGAILMLWASDINGSNYICNVKWEGQFDATMTVGAMGTNGFNVRCVAN